MADILKLKKKAADFEAKKQMDKALATYREMIEVYERGDEDPIDIPLYNRVGDLLQKSGNLSEAVSVWERAVDHYAEGGFYNPAIALCNKILRQSPGRAVVYYKLGKISAEKGFRADARQNFLEYASRMQKSGNLDEAFRALKEFADLVPDQDDVRLMLADQLVKAERKDEAIAQLQIAYAQCVRDGRSADASAIGDKIRAIDPSVEPSAEGGGGSSKGGGLVFLDLDPSPAVAVSARRTGTTPAADVKRMTKAVAGLELLDTGIDLSPAPAARPLTPERPAAAAPPAVEMVMEPTSVSEALVVEPTSVSEALVIEPTSVSQAMIIEPTSFIDVSAPVEPAEEPASVSLIEELPTVERLSRSLALEEIPMLDIEPSFATTESASAAIVEPPSVSDMTLLDLEPTTAASAAEALELSAAERASMEAVPTVERITADVPVVLPMIELEPTAIAPAVEEVVAPAVEEAVAPIEELSSVSPKIDLPMLDMVTPVEPPSAEPRRQSTGVGDFSSFGSRTGAASDEMLELGGFEPLEIESSEGVHALPLDESYVDTPPALIEAAPESPLPRAAPEEPPPLPRATSVVLANSVDLLRARAIDAPEDWGLRRQLAEALLDDGQREDGVAELEASLAGFERDGDLDTAASVAEEIVRLAPTVIRYHQKRVEFAFRANDRRKLAEAYVELADALVKDGQAPKARVVYQRVLKIEPDDLRAQAALETIADAPVPEPSPAPRRSSTMLGKKQTATTPPAATAKPKKADDDEFVSLGDWLREEEEPKSTRMVVEEKEPTGDEQADFADMLRKFKQGVSANVDEEDHEAHYDLGVAYKEMGLLDEAISEFQKALRGPNNRVRAIEALGQCFVEKQQLPVAATILQRALSEPGVRDDSLIGVLYLLGTISEELHLFPDAKRYYERVFAVDIQFRDIGDRLNAVEKQIT